MKDWKAFAWIIVLIPFVLFLTSALIIIHTRPIMQGLVQQYSHDIKNAGDTLDYYYSYIASETQELPVIPGMTDAELQHLRDVKQVWRYGLGYLAFLLGMLTIVIAKNFRGRTLSMGLEWSSLTTMMLMVVAGFVPFDGLWTAFHRMAFPQGNWVFAYNSKIIILFPPEFFQSVVLRIIVLTLFLALMTYGLAYLLKKHLEKDKTTKASE